MQTPLPVAWAIRRAQALVDPLLHNGAAAPPRRLRARTGAPGLREFTDGGREAAVELAAALKSAGRSLDDVGSVLDFGCGAGRVLPHLASLAPGATCTGCDVDRTAVGWAAGHRPELRWEVSQFDPPLPFAAESFDLVYSISVFSHLDEQRQDSWLKDIARVLRPDGVALLSVHGDHAFEQFRNGSVRTAWCPRSAFERPRLGDDELAFVPYRRSVWIEAELPGVTGDYGLAFHGGGYIRRHWATALHVVDVIGQAISSWQDLVVCEKL
jgi:SAM-dependent methyltransferase